MKVKILPSDEGRYHEKIVIPNYSKNSKILKRKFGSSFHSYYVYIKKGGVIFGRAESIGDRLDGWASHFYYIAVDEKTKEVIGAFHISHGWYGSFSYGKYDSVEKWKKAMLEKVKKKYEKRGLKC